eukprot:gene7066-419_t
MLRIEPFIIALAIIASSAQGEHLNPSNVLYIELDSGTVVISMYPHLAPNHVERIKELTRSGFYDNQIWHRVIEGFVAQTGDPLGKGYGGTGIHLQSEFGSRSHNTGTVNMARVSGDIDSADSQFSIMYKHNKFLDGTAFMILQLYDLCVGEYTVWGQVLGGFEHLKALSKGEP